MSREPAGRKSNLKRDIYMYKTVPKGELIVLYVAKNRHTCTTKS